MTMAHDHVHSGGGHSHGGGHDHSHAPPETFNLAFGLGIGLNTGLVGVQIVFGLIAGSVALLSDALHNLGDVLGLVLAWGAAGMGRWLPTARHTYGWGRSSILAALTNAVVLLLGSGAIALEAVQRFGDTAPVAGGMVMWVAALGIVINGGTAMLFMKGREGDLNVRGAFLHLAADALISLGVLVSGGLVLLTGWHWVDPLASLVIVAVITWGTWGLLKQSVALALDAVPAGLDRDAVQQALAGVPGVVEVHDLHIWGLSTTQAALTAHLVSEASSSDVVGAATALMHERFGIDHVTLQVEAPAMAAVCRLRPEAVV